MVQPLALHVGLQRGLGGYLGDRRPLIELVTALVLNTQDGGCSQAAQSPTRRGLRIVSVGPPQVRRILKASERWDRNKPRRPADRQGIATLEQHKAKLLA